LLEVQADMRNICFNIMPKSLELFGLVKAVEELCTKVELQGAMQIKSKMSRNFPSLPVQQGFAIFRIIQEFINNALKHSKADTLQINFSYVKKTARITLSDNGVGFDPEKLQHRGIGLNNIMSRMLPYDGEVNIISKPGSGTRYEISVPVGQKK
jgi:signal transduction histidine kinase